MLEQNYISAWRATTIEDVAGREKLFLAINIAGKVRDHLTATIANGKLAQAELKELAQIISRSASGGLEFCNFADTAGFVGCRNSVSACARLGPMAGGKNVGPGG